MEQNTDRLISEALKGNHRAWNLLITKFQKRIFAVALVVTKNMQDADDATQDTFVKLFKNLKYIREPDKLEGWLTKTVLNKAKDICRRRKIRKWLPLAHVKEAEPQNAERSFYRKELEKIFNEWRAKNLSKKEELVFQLRIGEELELAEIADGLGMNINTVKTHLYRAMKKLKKGYRNEE